MVGHAKAVGMGGSEDGMLKVLYIANQMMVIKGLVDKHADVLPPLTSVVEVVGTSVVVVVSGSM